MALSYALQRRVYLSEVVGGSPSSTEAGAPTVIDQGYSCAPDGSHLEEPYYGEGNMLLQDWWYWTGDIVLHGTTVY